MIVRPAKLGDLPAIERILSACELRVDEVDYTEWTGWLLVAERQGEVIGFVHVVPAKPYAIVAELGVLPEFQKSRAAYKLMESVELMLRAGGYGYWSAYLGDCRNGVHATVTAWGGRDLGSGHMFGRSL